MVKPAGYSKDHQLYRMETGQCGPYEIFQYGNDRYEKSGSSSGGSDSAGSGDTESDGICKNIKTIAPSE